VNRCNSLTSSQGARESVCIRSRLTLGKGAEGWAYGATIKQAEKKSTISTDQSSSLWDIQPNEEGVLWKNKGEVENLKEREKSGLLFQGGTCVR